MTLPDPSLGLLLTTYYRYGYHVPAVNRRDTFYSKLEDQRAANAAA
jgi:cytochrome c oxidase subunit 7